MTKRLYNSLYTGEYLNRVAFPLGGIGAGMLCLEGAGALSHVSLDGRADVFNEPLMFAALSVSFNAPAGSQSRRLARVLEGPVPVWKAFGAPGAGNGLGGTSYGLLQGLTGVRHDAIERVLYIQPNIPGDFRAFLSTATGYGTAGVQNGEPFVEVKSGVIPFEKLNYIPYPQR